MNQYQIDEGFGYIFKNPAYRWLLSSIEEYLGSRYSNNKSKRISALKRIRVNLLKNKMTVKIKNLIKDEHKLDVSEKDIIKVFENIIRGRVDLYKIHKDLYNSMSEDFNNEHYKKFKREMVKIFDT